MNISYRLLKKRLDPDEGRILIFDDPTEEQRPRSLFLSGIIENQNSAFRDPDLTWMLVRLFCQHYYIKVAPSNTSLLVTILNAK